MLRAHLAEGAERRHVGVEPRPPVAAEVGALVRAGRFLAAVGYRPGSSSSHPGRGPLPTRRRFSVPGSGGSSTRSARAISSAELLAASSRDALSRCDVALVGMFAI